ncbi:glutamate--ammonia ligase [Suttonella ornithocola]|uniref:Glutamine synthetase n=1 Tax=Suttonella ornithocola TaxID=279832 RepID=A0A380MLB6_9GAMM|nr:glutamate--ammonia ligase [Suttonella ornithocola]SUO93048.1 Glutamine synthetase [Suttonella ornithocola]
MTPDSIIQRIEEEDIRFVDLRFTDTKGKEHHVSMPAKDIDEDFFEEGKMFDGSSIAGWKGINESDMILMPDAETAFIDPFTQLKTLVISCDIIEPDTLQGYSRDPRSLAKRAENYLKSTGIADTALLGPENEFFIFDGIKYKTSIHKTSVEILSEEGYWNSDADFGASNRGHRPGLKGGYFPVAPVDSLNDIRAEMCEILEDVGLVVEVHHHEVATAGQCEIGVKFNTLTKKADEVQKLKYVIHNVADMYGKTATFMPKPLVGDNGSGMHVHISLVKDGKNLFTGDGYGGLSETAIYFIGGIIKHARALNAFTNPSINSYKRLVPHFEAPVMLAYSARNRSASIRVPYIFNPKARRIEVRFPDSTANPYFAFAALLMAGLDGIKNKIHPGDAMDKDLYDLPPEEADNIPQVAFSLEQALDALEADNAFLKAGDVFSEDLIDAYIALKREEVAKMRLQVHPMEFELYYSC